MITPVVVPGRTVAVQVTRSNAADVVEWTRPWISWSAAYPPHVQQVGMDRVIVHLGAQGKRVLVAFEDDWVVLDRLSGKVQVVMSGWRAVELGLEQAEEEGS